MFHEIPISSTFRPHSTISLLLYVLVVSAISYYLFLNLLYRMRVREPHDSYKVHIWPLVSIYPRKKENLRINKLKKEAIFKKKVKGF